MINSYSYVFAISSDISLLKSKTSSLYFINLQMLIMFYHLLNFIKSKPRPFLFDMDEYSSLLILLHMFYTNLKFFVILDFLLSKYSHLKLNLYNNFKEQMFLIIQLLNLIKNE